MTPSSSGLLTTVEDLAHWDENFYTAKVGGQQLVNSLQEPGQLNDGTRLAYAEGLFVSPPGGLKIAESGDAGVRLRLPTSAARHARSVATAATANQSTPAISHRVADVMLAEVVPRTPRGGSGRPETSVQQPASTGD